MRIVMADMIKKHRKVSGALLAAFLSVATFAIVEIIARPAPVSAQQLGTPIACGTSVAISTASAATGELVALTTNKTIFVCDFTIAGAGTSTVKFVTGTGTACATGTADLTGAMSVATATSVVGRGIAVPISKALCLVNGQAVQVSGFISYRKF
jgi:hypothetical protein